MKKQIFKKEAINNKKTTIVNPKGTIIREKTYNSEKYSATVAAKNPPSFRGLSLRSFWSRKSIFWSLY